MIIKLVVHQLELSDLKTLKKKNKDGRQWYTSEKKDYAYVVQKLWQLKLKSKCNLHL